MGRPQRGALGASAHDRPRHHRLPGRNPNSRRIAMNPITEDDIADFLLNTPDFFERHAELLATVQLTSPHGHRAVGLQERQAEMLREKIRVLELRMMDM